jgi:hypothetical protein
MWCEDIVGLRWIAVDNSTGHVSSDQLAFFLAAVTESDGGGGGGDGQCVLLVHIPLYSSGLLAHGRTDGNTPLTPGALMGCPADVVTGGGSGEQEELDREFLRAVAGAGERLLAVLSGHIHDATAFPLDAPGGPGGVVVQYTVDAGCYDGSRVIDFVAPAAARL